MTEPTPRSGRGPQPQGHRKPAKPLPKARVQPPLGVLDAAWAAVEAALPEGWALWLEPGASSRYHVMAERRTPLDEWDDGVDAENDDLVAALLALAAKLKERTP